LVFRFQVLTAASKQKTTAFWNTAPCRLAEVDDVSEVPSASVYQGDMCIARKMKTESALKRRTTSMTLHGALSQTAVVFETLITKHIVHSKYQNMYQRV